MWERLFSCTAERLLKDTSRFFKSPLQSVDHLICYSMKACSNLAVLRIFGNLGAGVDIVSGGELYRALKAGIDPSRVVYSGVGKKASEMDEALTSDILMFNIESEEELDLLDQRAQALGKRARIALRVNPDVDPLTHPYISTGLKKNKFGIDVEKSVGLYRKALDMNGIEPRGCRLSYRQPIDGTVSVPGGCGPNQGADWHSSFQWC